MRLGRKGGTALAAMALALTGCAWVERIDVPVSGTEPNRNLQPGQWLSGDGRYVYFSSHATNLVAATDGTEPGDDTGGLFRRDQRSGTTVLLRPGAQLSADPAISADQRRLLLFEQGRWVVLDRTAGTAQPVVVDSNEVPLPGTVRETTLSGDGRVVAFRLSRPGDQATYVRDLDAGTTKLVAAIAPSPGNPYLFFFRDAFSLSRDGALLAQGTCAASRDSLRGPECTARSFELIDAAAASVARPFPNQPTVFSARLSADGRLVVYVEDVQGLRNVWSHNRSTGARQLVSADVDGQPATGSGPSVSTSGRYVAFTSSGANLVPGLVAPELTQFVYVRDRRLRVTTLVSADVAGNAVPLRNLAPHISGDGRYVAFFNDGVCIPPTGTIAGRWYTKSVLVPRVTSAAPSSATTGTTAHVTLSGYGFRPDSEVYVHRNGTLLPAAELASTDTTLDVDVTVPSGAPLGAYEIAVFTPGGGPGRNAGAAAACRACFRVG
jgi:Tol biopolymer transport system component